MGGREAEEESPLGATDTYNPFLLWSNLPGFSCTWWDESWVWYFQVLCQEMKHFSYLQKLKCDLWLKRTLRQFLQILPKIFWSDKAYTLQHSDQIPAEKSAGPLCSQLSSCKGAGLENKVTIDTNIYKNCERETRDCKYILSFLYLWLSKDKIKKHAIKWTASGTAMVMNDSVVLFFFCIDNLGMNR